jgi:hypothetical protein
LKVGRWWIKQEKTMDQAQALAMAADNPNFPGWLRDACRVATIHMVSAGAEVERLNSALAAERERCAKLCEAEHVLERIDYKDGHP